MKRDSMVFYRSWLEAVKKIKKNSDKLKFYEAITEYGLNGETVDTGHEAIELFMINVRAQLDANNRNYENGKKPKKAPLKRKESGGEANKERKRNNENVNANANENGNGNDNKRITSSDSAPLEEGRSSEAETNEEDWEFETP